MASYEPSSEWQRDEKSDTLRIKVPGFKRENLRVQVDSSKKVIVTGEGGDNQREFKKEFNVPEGCIPRSIRARFDSDTETLIITFPKEPMAGGAPADKTGGQKADNKEGGRTGQEKVESAAGQGMGMRVPGRGVLVYTAVGVLVFVLVGACLYLTYQLGKATEVKKIITRAPE